jgi:hypothetical protein
MSRILHISSRIGAEDKPHIPGLGLFSSAEKKYLLLSCGVLWSRAAVLGRLGSLSPTTSWCSILPIAHLYGAALSYAPSFTGRGVRTATSPQPTLCVSGSVNYWYDGRDGYAAAAGNQGTASW